MGNTRASVRFYIRPARITAGGKKAFVYDIVDSAGEHAPARYWDPHTAILTCDLREDDHAAAVARAAAVETAQDAATLAVESGTTGPRGEVRMSFPSRPGFGMSRRWTRVLRGTVFSFTAVTMPSGELRYSASRWVEEGVPGTPGHPNFGCYWRPVFAVTVPAGRESLWSNEGVRFWGRINCERMFRLFEVSAPEGGRPRVSADAVTDHVAACETCQEDDMGVSLLTDGTWELKGACVN